MTRRRAAVRRVVHVSPAYFSDNSYIGGGERYATNLARTMADQVKTTLISFGPERTSFQQGRLRVEIYPAICLPDGVVLPLAPYTFLHQLVRADVIHCHQYRSIVTNLAMVGAAMLGKRIFVTDHGGGRLGLTDELPLSDLVHTFLAVSRFSATNLPCFRRTRIVYGGVEEHLIEGVAAPERAATVLFVGRLLPHKGINYLIDALDGDGQLNLMGRAYDQEYLSRLRELAAGKRVQFVTNASDDDVRRAYQGATVTVLPSVYRDVDGHTHEAPELLGLALLESMACATPVVCTDVGGMPEVVEHGVTGFVVPPNDPEALRERIGYLLRNPGAALEMGKNGRRKVMSNFTWSAVADRCRSAYCE